jgi:hypothetical protein
MIQLTRTARRHGAFVHARDAAIEAALIDTERVYGGNIAVRRF